MGYRKPLLIELFVEIDLDASLTGARVLDLAENLRSLGLNDVELAGRLQASAAPFQARLRCWADDHRKLVQLSTDQIVVNQVGEYLGWKDFSAFFTSVISAAERVAPWFPGGIGLHAVDQLVVTSADFTVGRYFSCNGERIPQWYANCAHACDLSMGRGLYPQEGHNRQLNLGVRPEADTFRIQLSTIFKDRLGERPVGDALEALHIESNKLFESLITAETRRIME